MCTFDTETVDTYSTSRKNDTKTIKKIRQKLRFAMGWTVRESNPGGGRFSALVEIGPPKLVTMDAGSPSLGILAYSLN